MPDDTHYVSYKSPSTVVSETVYQFLHGCLYGGVWGLVSPFPAPGSAAALKETQTGVFRPVAPFSSLSNVPHQALFFGSILGVQRLACKSLELVRRREDLVNEAFGFACLYPYYHYVLNHSEQRLVRHNRLVGSTVAALIVYGSFFA